jgi:hypothetical protein
MRMETDPVSIRRSLVSLEYWAMEEVQKPCNSGCYTPSKEPRIYITPDLSSSYLAMRTVTSFMKIESLN